ncbi:MAG: sulfotransferase family 2 domain-containing protein [Bacteroidota bacterium]
MTSNFSSNYDEFPLYKKLPNGKELLFIHLPKTAGTSINRTLQLPRPNDLWPKKHYDITEVKQVVPPEVLQSAFLFSVVRNPWDRLVSFYFYRRKVYLQRAAQRTAERDQHFSSFATWVHSEQAAGLLGKKNLRPQCKWICDEHKRPVVDFIGRFENISSDFQEICTCLGLPSIPLQFHNKSERPADYRVLYNDYLRDLVKEVYQPDIDLFGYQY